jgi:L-lactate dehydrogenase
MPNICKLKSSFETTFKVSMIGCGSVGATAAYAMLLDGTPTELVLIDHSKEKAEGLMLDFEHSLSFLKSTKITASDDYSACKDSQLIFITAGARQSEGETRLQLIDKNRKIFREIVPALAKYAPKAILVVVTNPVDVLTYETIKLSGFPEGRVFGTGTMLDTARFRYHISERLCLSPHSIEAYILGEHGDTSFPVFSSANVAGKPLNEFAGFTAEVGRQCYEDTRNAAYRIIHDLGYTCYSIAVVMREIMVNIFQHSKIVVPLSVELKDYYGYSDVCLSVPCVLDSDGVSGVIKVPLNDEEQAMLAKSAETVRAFVK